MNFAALLNSSVGKKIVTGITGLLLVGFVVGHLIGNLSLFLGPGAFNHYAYFLENVGHGALLPVVELGLIAVFLGHIWSSMTVRIKGKARTKEYSEVRDAGHTSQKSWASMTMHISGVLLLIFVVVHVITFKYGDHTHIVDHGVEMKNLYGLVVESFGNPFYTLFYLVVMALLGSHLYHGIWSAFQSLGLANDNYLPRIKWAGYAASVLLAVGFFFLPLIIFLMNDYFMQINATYVASLGGH